jgi:hypothetical protein
MCAVGCALQLAKADLVKVKDLEPWNWEAEEEERRMVRLSDSSLPSRLARTNAG